MLNWIYIICHAIIEAIRGELAFRKVLRNLKENPPEKSEWSDAVARMTLDQWKAAVEKLGYGFPERQALTDLKQDTQDRKLAEMRRLGLIRDLNVKRSRRRPRSKFKKRWPHGKHSG